jgi:hypothetical protein
MTPMYSTLTCDEVFWLLMNVKLIAKPQYRTQSWRCLASHLFAVGSTTAAELCKRAGLDPFEIVGKP